MLVETTELMGCSSIKRLPPGSSRSSFIRNGKKEYAQFVTFVGEDEEERHGLCANN